MIWVVKNRFRGKFDHFHNHIWPISYHFCHFWVKIFLDCHFGSELKVILAIKRSLKSEITTIMVIIPMEFSDRTAPGPKNFQITLFLHLLDFGFFFNLNFSKMMTSSSVIAKFQCQNRRVFLTSKVPVQIGKYLVGIKISPN